MLSLAHCSITRIWNKETKMGIASATYAADTVIGLAAVSALSLPEQIPFGLCVGVAMAQIVSGAGAVIVAGTRPQNIKSNIDEENPANERSTLLQSL